MIGEQQDSWDLYGESIKWHLFLGIGRVKGTKINVKKHVKCTLKYFVGAEFLHSCGHSFGFFVKISIPDKKYRYWFEKNVNCMM